MTSYHYTHRRAIAALLSVSTLALAAPARAQDVVVEAEGPETSTQDDLHKREVEYKGEIVVSATGLKQLDVLAGTSVMEGAELQRNMAGQVGDVLAKLPGVSATSFAPGVSRPVLRGFSGERVKVLVDGLGAIDVSNTSADHAVSIDPLTAERIEVLRGPAVMLYGSQAIGGAVNVIDKRIPRRIPDEAVHVDALAGADTVAHLREGGASIDVPVGDMFAFHLDGSYRTTNDVRVPGYTIVPALRAEILAEAAADEADEPEEAAELREAADQRGRLPNSATETLSANVGFALFAGESDLGLSGGIFDTVYGVPGRPGAGHAHGEDGDLEGEAPAEEEQVTIALRQYRTDLRGHLDLGDGFFSSLQTRVGYSDYTHTEFEGEEVGTVFDVQGLEARAVLEQASRNGWGGSLGAQYYFRDFTATGAEAFIAPNRTRQFALFGLQEYGPGPVQVEGALRYETTQADSTALGLKRKFDTISGALGLAYETDEALRFGVNVSRAARAPSAEELFSNGPHVATQSFEVGNPDFSSERAWGVEGFFRGKLGTANVSAAIFKSWFDDYIYLADSGLEQDGLPVFTYLQGDADYFGIEGEVNVPFYSNGTVTLLADIRGDWIRASLSDGTPLPRIPPLSLLGALEAQTERFDARAEVQYSAAQDRVAPFETPTDSFVFVNALLAWKPLRGDDNLTLLFQVDNVFDVEGRRHASFTKDFVLLPGRNFKISARASF